ncbi:MAG: hypothetical protein RLZZ403_847 [Pseudomonadota bacterium]|jgi:hypothetical protein
MNTPYLPPAPAVTRNPIMRYFAYKHLPEHLQEVSRVVSGTAVLLDALLPEGPEKSAGMRKLFEAKDCFVRAALPADPEPGS